ncbi:3547_t:CDS:1 [Ambispora gerdemannii]|uniref:3547_t:CDS:1 n=1 Tax=Ambispora gerdemannii TaxID=144530 RepID=A0A9N9DDV9_9GLOM|nr:3547_t:CDS:1 [Ambispora gerdemannii]
MSNYEYLSVTERQLLSKCPYHLTLAIEVLTKPSAKKRGNYDKPPRPQNSWIIFRTDYEANIRQLNPNIRQKVSHTAKECSLKWKLQSREVKNFFKILEKIARKNHEHIYPNYKYKPKNTKDPSCKKFTFREQKKYSFTSSAKFGSRNDNLVEKEAKINPSPFLTNNMSNNFSSFTSSTTQYNPHNIVCSIPTSIDNFSASSNHQFLFDGNDNNLIDYLLNTNFYNSTLISAPIDITNTASVPTASLISSPSPHAQISISEYFTYDSTYMVGNFSNVNF